MRDEFKSLFLNNLDSKSTCLKQLYLIEKVKDVSIIHFDNQFVLRDICFFSFLKNDINTRSKYFTELLHIRGPYREAVRNRFLIIAFLGVFQNRIEDLEFQNNLLASFSENINENKYIVYSPSDVLAEEDLREHLMILFTLKYVYLKLKYLLYI